MDEWRVSIVQNNKTGSFLLIVQSTGTGGWGVEVREAGWCGCPPSFGDRVEHGERPLKVASGISLCAWFVKWVVLVA